MSKTRPIKKCLGNQIVQAVFVVIVIITVIIIIATALKPKSKTCDDTLIGDGLCEDAFNIASCNFDGGDCCLGNQESTASCTYCICYATQKAKNTTKYSSLATSKISTTALVSDIASSLSSTSTTTTTTETATTEPKSDTTVTSTTTTPFVTQVDTTASDGTCRKDQNNVGNGWCDDETNHEDCQFDGGDCCFSEIYENFCSRCICKEDGNRHPTSEDLIVIGCTFPELKGDGVCDDSMNWKACGYDGGDCCYGELISCERCLCFLELAQCDFYRWITDGECDDLANTEECNYDGGDCCLEVINKQFCEECMCHADGTVHNGYEPATSCSIPAWVGDGACDDTTNVAECDFDGGDCCLDTVDTTFCVACECLSK